MKPISLTPEFEDISRHVIWFEEPKQATADPVRFIAYAMTYGTHDDMKVVRQQFSDEELIEALDRAPPGIFDARSWAYWNLKLNRDPDLPMPVRSFD
ncbi:MAG: hypothetical protein PHH11_10255 [Methylomonas sp.]|nr:hypothetical protein [Methylomonas sp.]